MSEIKENFKVFDARIKAPFSMIIAGPSNSGKTTFVTQLLNNSKSLIDQNVDYILWFYGQVLPVKHPISNCTFVHGLPSSFDEYIKPGLHGLIIFDDLMNECINNSSITDFFTKRSHHENLSIIFITQNFFCEGKERKTFTKNAAYIVIFNSPLDKQTAYSMARKIMPKDISTFYDIYDHAVNKPHGYLFIDGHQKTSFDTMLRTDIFNDFQRCYTPKKK